MKNVLCIFLVIFVVIVNSCKIDEEIESDEYLQKLQFSFQNETTRNIDVKIELVRYLDDYQEWDKCDYCIQGAVTQEKIVESGEEGDFLFECFVPEYSFPFQLSFVIYIDDNVYCGFSKTDKRTDYFTLDETKVQKDSLHWIFLSGSENIPSIYGSLSASTLRISDADKIYTSVAEKFSVEIRDEEVLIELDSVEF